MSQKQRWEEEYSRYQNLPSSRRVYPARAVVNFLEAHPNLSGKAIDMGSGKGRNSIYLAQRGFDVVGVEFAHEAIVAARALVDQLQLANPPIFLEQSVAAPIDEPDRYFDLAVDMMMLHLLNQDERSAYAATVQRLLASGGYLILKTLAAESSDAHDLIDKYAGEEPNSYILPGSGMIEKCFTQDELIELFGSLELEDCTTLHEPVEAFGDVFHRTYLIASFQKAVGKL